MSRCEDWPCCGHEAGCCPDFDASGRQLNMKCTCGAVLPIDARYSICETCMRRGFIDEYAGDDEFIDDREVDEFFDDEDNGQSEDDRVEGIMEDDFSRFDDDPNPYEGTYSEE